MESADINYKMKRGQVWVETVIYTLVGLALIGLVLAVVTPKINEYRDRAIIEQTLESLELLDTKINEVLRSIGNAREVEFSLKRGDIYFNNSGDSISYVLEDSRVIYSQPGEETSVGRFIVLTEKGNKAHKVSITLNYDIDIVTDANGEIKKFSAAAVPYKFLILNNGTVNNRVVVVISELSGA